MKRRPWRCCCRLPDGSTCPARGWGADERETTAAFYRHYAAKHMEKAEGSA